MKTTPFRFVFAAATLLSASSAFAATYQWDTNDVTAGLGGTGTWDTTTANWDLVGTGADDGTGPTQSVTFTGADIAQFGGTAGTVTLSSAITSIANGLTFTAANYKLNIGASGQSSANNTGISGAISLGTNALTINALGASGKNTTISLSGPISGSGTLNLGSGDTGVSSGNSFINITGSNSGTFTGAVNILRTTVSVDSMNTLGGATGANITLGGSNSSFAAGLTFTNLGGAVSTSRIRFNSGGNTLAVRNNDANAANTLTLTNSSVSNPSSGSNVTTIEFGGTNTGNNTVSWNIVNPTPAAGSTTIAVKKADSGTWVLSGTNTFTSGLTVSAGTLVTGNTSALGSGNVSAAAGTLQIGNGTTNSVNLGNNATITIAAGAKLALGGLLNGVSGALDGGTGSVITLQGTGTYTFNGTGILDLGGFLNSSSTGLISGTHTYKLFSGGAGTGNTDVLLGNITGFDSSVSNLSISNGVLTFTAVPEPSTYGLMGAGALAAVAFVRRRRKHAGEAA